MSDCIDRIIEIIDLNLIERGGPTSGFRGHKGVKGQRGGSVPRGGGEGTTVSVRDVLDDVEQSFKKGNLSTGLTGRWTRERRGGGGEDVWEQEQDGVVYTIVGDVYTTPKMIGRLREPSGTRYNTVINLIARSPGGPPHLREQYKELYNKTVKGEHPYNKLDEMHNQVAKRVEKTLGIPAEEFTFNYH